jgi:hypothetical protein
LYVAQAGFFAQNAEDIARRIDRDMSNALGGSSFALREKLALACRMLADEGHARTLAGQITVRADPRWLDRRGARRRERHRAKLFRRGMRVVLIV